MPTTDKTKEGAVTYWIDYEVQGTDAVAGKLIVQALRDNGTTVTLVSDVKKSYGRSFTHALEGLGKRLAQSKDRMVTLINEV